MTFDNPFHRAADFLCRPGDQAKLGIDHAAGAEITADVLHQHADLLGRHVKHFGEIVLQPHRAAVAGMDGEAAGRLVEFGKRRARLHRHAGDALHPGLEPRHMSSAGERRFRRIEIAEVAVEADVGAGAVVHARRILSRRRHGIDHGWKNFVIDLHRLCAVLRCKYRVSDNHRDGLADKARFICRQRMVRRLERCLAVLHPRHGFCLVRRPRYVGNRFQAAGESVGTCEDRDHAGYGPGFVGFDRTDARMGMRRADHHRINLPRQILVGGVAAVAAYQTQVFAPSYGLADAGAGCRLIHQVLFSQTCRCRWADRFEFRACTYKRQWFSCSLSGV